MPKYFREIGNFEKYKKCYAIIYQTSIIHILYILDILYTTGVSHNSACGSVPKHGGYQYGWRACTCYFLHIAEVFVVYSYHLDVNAFLYLQIVARC